MTIQQLQAAITFIYPAAKYQQSYTLKVDAAGAASIALWDNSVGDQPTPEQLIDSLVTIAIGPARERKMVELQSAYFTARYGTPVTITSTSGQVLTFPSDVPTQQNIVGYVCSGDEDWQEGGEPLQTMDGGVALISYADVKAIAKAIRRQSTASWVTLMGLLGEVNAATTVDAVNAINWPLA